MERRKLLKLGAGTSAFLATGGAMANALQSLSQDSAVTQRTSGGEKLRVTPACDHSTKRTRSQTEGPYYTRNTPHRNSLVGTNTVGSPLLLEGYVVNTKCEPIPGAVLDFWSCDGNGVYDNEGMKLRGHQFTDENGYYRLETVRPGHYSTGPFSVRTSHIHVKVQGENTAMLTTQLYFPDDPQNQKDGIFHPDLLVNLAPGHNGSHIASFVFVLA